MKMRMMVMMLGVVELEEILQFDAGSATIARNLLSPSDL